MNTKRMRCLAARVVSVLMMFMALTASALAAGQTKTDRPDFNHDATGYPLTGAHVVAACENCHVGGVFKGTPHECEGCHANGRRVAATPKSTAHIVTTAACDTCHFNTVSFLGAKFNHGAAKPGQCTSCHNGRQSRAKAANHTSGLKATESCDKCHRTYAWVPATWNHSGTGSCDQAGCHRQNENQYYRSATTHATTAMLTYACSDCHNYFAWTPGKYKHNTAATCSSCHSAAAIVKSENRKPASHTATAIKGINECNDCHSTQGWLPATFKHTGAGTCTSCHDGIKAQGKGVSHGYTTLECNVCHTNTTTWLGASYHNGAVAGICGTCHDGANNVKGTINDPNGTHIPLTGNGDPNCDLCHTSQTSFASVTMNHAGKTTCNTCHASTSTYVVSTKRQIGNHQGSTAGQDCSECHSSTTTWQGALGAKPSNHIPYSSGSCSSCHTSGGILRGTALHVPYLSGMACTTCHLKGNAYAGWGQDTKSVGHEGMKAGDDCSKSGCHKPLGNRGSSYTKWD